MTFIEELEAEAREQLAVIRAARETTGDQESRQRTKAALGVIGAYVRLRATLANEKSNALIERRLLQAEDPPRQLIGAGQ